MCVPTETSGLVHVLSDPYIVRHKPRRQETIELVASYKLMYLREYVSAKRDVAAAGKSIKLIILYIMYYYNASRCSSVRTLTHRQ